MRPPVVFYNRANEAAALLKPGDFDWSAIFAGGVRWFHSGGIFASLSATTSELILEGMAAAGQCTGSCGVKQRCHGTGRGLSPAHRVGIPAAGRIRDRETDFVPRCSQ